MNTSTKQAHEPEVSAVITFHREGLLAHTTLLSIERCRIEAEKEGSTVELVITLDNADVETERIVRGHPVLRPSDRVLPVSFRDLSTCRNHAVEHAGGNYIAIFDGDDYFSKNWLTQCLSLIKREGDSRIYHPALMVAFDAWNAYWYQIDQLDPNYQNDSLLSMNYWNACAFAARKTFIQCPYAVSRVGEAGFGYEDWHWNCETIAEGYVHRAAEKTIRFERRKSTGSLNVAHQGASAVVRPSKFFDIF